eukprot:387237_1
MQIPSLIHTQSNITSHELNNARLRPQTDIKQRRYRKVLPQNNMHYCYDCDQWKESHAFYPNKLTRCKLCSIQVSTSYQNELRGFIRHLHATA